MFHDWLLRLRGLHRRPGTPLFAASILALGIAGTLSVASVVRGVLLQDLPYPEPDELALVWRGTAEDPSLRGALSPGDWVDVRQRVGSFEDVAGVNSFRTTYLPDDGDPEQVDLGVVTGNFFQVLGVRPELGRGIRPGDDRPVEGQDGLAVVVLDHDFWRTRFGADPGVVGRTIRFGGDPHQVIGVMPEGFELLLPADAGMTTDLQGWIPLALDYATQARDGFYLKVLARMAPGVGPGQAGAELSSVAAALRSEHPVHADAGFRLRLAPLHDEVVAHVRSFLLVLGGVGGLVLLVTCANVSALLLVRFVGRGPETAVRRALGAQRPRLVGGFLVESAAVAAAGTALGLALAGPLVEALLALQPGLVPRAGEVAVDGSLALGAVGLAALVALLCGLGPAWLGSSGRSADLLRSRGGGGHRVVGRLHGALVVLQVAGCFLLLHASATVLSDLARVGSTDMGYDARGVTTFQVSLPFGSYRAPESWAAFYDALVQRLEADPSVETAAAVTGLPTASGEALEPWRPVEVAGSESWGTRRALHQIAMPDYFDVMGMEVRAGRSFGPADGAEDPVVAVVDEAMAEALGRDGGGVLGRRIEVTRHEFTEGYRVARVAAEVVGVVESVPHGHPDAPAPGTVYLPLAQYPLWAMAVVARGPGEGLPASAAVRGALADVDPALPAVSLRPMTEVARATLGPTRFVLALLSALALLVVALAVAGLYGIIAETVLQRRRELGVRLALGATAGRVRLRVLSRGLLLAGIGIVPGLVLAPGLGDWLRGILGFRGSLELGTMVATGGLVLLVAVAASWLPGWRAGRLDPVRVLRSE